jgi:SAM-dependent MidA family methyltransferase
MCHYRHRAHDDPFLLPGLQDITAWVDFSDCAAAARSAGLHLSGYTTQGSWLAETVLNDAPGMPAHDARSAAWLKTLLLPGEMGERFKVLHLSREVVAAPLLRGRDMRGWL